MQEHRVYLAAYAAFHSLLKFPRPREEHAGSLLSTARRISEQLGHLKQNWPSMQQLHYYSFEVLVFPSFGIWGQDCLFQGVKELSFLGHCLEIWGQALAQASYALPSSSLLSEVVLTHGSVLGKNKLVCS